MNEKQAKYTSPSWLESGWPKFQTKLCSGPVWHKTDSSKQGLVIGHIGEATCSRLHETIVLQCHVNNTRPSMHDQTCLVWLWEPIPLHHSRMNDSKRLCQRFRKKSWVTKNDTHG
jgi:hypothetical protein